MREEYSENVRRWYDKDPVLSRSMRTLEFSDDKTQITVAWNIIKIIIEHNLAYSEYSSVEDLIDAVDDGLVSKGHSRWYDIDRTLHTAITLLEESDEEVQSFVAKEMAKMVIDKIKEVPEIDDPDADLDLDSEDDDDDDDYQEGDYKKL